MAHVLKAIIVLVPLVLGLASWLHVPAAIQVEQTTGDEVFSGYAYHTCNLGYDPLLSNMDCEVYRDLIDRVPDQENLVSSSRDALTCSLGTLATAGLPEVNKLTSKILDELSGDMAEAAMQHSADCDPARSFEFLRQLRERSQRYREAFDAAKLK